MSGFTNSTFFEKHLHSQPGEPHDDKVNEEDGEDVKNHKEEEFRLGDFECDDLVDFGRRLTHFIIAANFELAGIKKRNTFESSGFDQILCTAQEEIHFFLHLSHR